MDKLKMQSENLVDENIEKIAKLFPNCVTEGKNEQGKVVKLVDFDMLKQELSKDIVEGSDERYTLNWAGKKQAILTANAPINATLRPCREESVDFDNTKNLYIEGDNLDVLKLLRETYLGKVKMIYIDPPYNTGHDFVYEDDFSTSAEEYLQASKNYDEQGNRMFQNNDSNGRYHSDWLSMMYSRLKLARDFLSDDGVIFVSIDDNESHNLRKICDEVFGSGSFITCITRATGTPTGGGFEGIVNELDYILVYAKNNAYTVINGLPMDEEDSKIYDQQDEYGRFLIRPLRRTGGEDRREDRPTMYFPIEAPDGSEVYPIGPTGYESRWICSPETVKKLKDNHLLAWKKTMKNGVEQWQVYQKFYLENRMKSAGNLWVNVEGNKKATRDIRDIFEGDKTFDFPKPIGVVKKMLQIGSCKESIILDFFSGSATTAHAVMQLNAEDGGNRQFILVQLPELCDESSEAYKAGYKNICEIGKERIRRAGKMIKEELAGRNKIVDKMASLSTQESFIEKSREIHNENADIYNNLDTGFRVLKLDSSCMKDVYYNPDELSQNLLAGLEDNIKEDRSPEDILFQVMLDMGVMLSSEIKVENIAGKKVFNVNDGNLVCCFDKNLTDEVVTQIAKMHPLYAVFRDGSMASDSVNVNFDQIFETYSPTTTRKVL